jgi:BirA family biotin operon repressor/biotin-[acetyl-CoA-carboxylase] ligase
VRAELPGGGEIYGIAKEIDAEGRLVIHTPEPVVVSAADVWHLRN